MPQTKHRPLHSQTPPHAHNNTQLHFWAIRKFSQLSESLSSSRAWRLAAAFSSAAPMLGSLAQRGAFPWERPPLPRTSLRWPLLPRHFPSLPMTPVQSPRKKNIHNLFSVIFLSLYQFITSNACVSSVVCVAWCACVCLSVHETERERVSEWVSESMRVSVCVRWNECILMSL